MTEMLAAGIPQSRSSRMAASASLWRRKSALITVSPSPGRPCLGVVGYSLLSIALLRREVDYPRSYHIQVGRRRRLVELACLVLVLFAVMSDGREARPRLLGCRLRAAPVYGRVHAPFENRT